MQPVGDIVQTNSRLFSKWVPQMSLPKEKQRILSRLVSKGNKHFTDMTPSEQGHLCWFGGTLHKAFTQKDLWNPPLQAEISSLRNTTGKHRYKKRSVLRTDMGEGTWCLFGLVSSGPRYFILSLPPRGLPFPQGT